MDKWVNRRVNPQGTCSHRLFCFPWAGGGTLFYAAWTKLLPGNIEVNAIRLPGRESRFKDPLYSNLDLLIEELCRILLPSLQEKPFSFFGHSMGAIVCFELACYLKKHHNLEPVHMFLSGATAPYSTLRQEKVTDKPLDQLTDDEFLERLGKLGGTPKEVLANKSLIRLFIPVIRADLILLEKYSKEAPSDPPLSCPMNFFDGAEDRTRNHDIDNWKTISSGSFDVQLLPGEHFYLQQEENTAKIIQTIAEKLKSS
ncbi:S-acyl fatty acid synthase thioesterase, medium chain-like [Asterias rubens]|uniref:S-acyl fatty acid synthase thioesterase, medium chain-like n=1 Tax=Asterias rubens TaxID=7604 RepID=UPI001455C157|nr:S-acyl fatty acid synthase thioesterase, medium chain-like [Asterias rubens]XP_033639703.1 S-acyl fatty acid synthase thioesterase, medium chain-like [Asterias rubens]XP_033639704.1 S-acyl fatty acid synthase thioesterase, medium chain-like [Asterias rubens]